MTRLLHTLTLGSAAWLGSQTLWAAPAASTAARSANPLSAAATTTVPSPSAAALAAPSSGAVAAPAPSAANPGRRVATATCVEHLPSGKARPELSERFPKRGTSGHRVTLSIRIKHGKGERVLPGALNIQSEGDAAEALKRAGFLLPDVGGPAAPKLTTQSDKDGTVTEVRISVVPMPKEAGRHELTLPPLPVAMARASGEVITLCTAAHELTVEDPAVNKPMAMPKSNPEPRRQQELWHALRNAVYGVGAGAALAGLLALLFSFWRRRPKKVAPEPPPRPAWELALESLYDIRQARLVEQGRLHDHFDRVSLTLKEYLGRRFGFDGPESTTEEILGHLGDCAEAQGALPGVDAFLAETDLVKFAKQAPTEPQCESLLEQAELIVRDSTPKPLSPATSAKESP